MAKQMEREVARKILADCNVEIGQDYDRLDTDRVLAILDAAAERGYKKPKDANGSTGRYFHAYLQRRAGGAD